MDSDADPPLSLYITATLAFQLRQLPDHRFKFTCEDLQASLMLATGITFSVHPPALWCPHRPER